MSRKDYIAIAAAIAETMALIRADVEAGVGHLIEADAVAINIGDEIAAYCAKDNPSFDRQRFFEAADLVNLIPSGRFQEV